MKRPVELPSLKIFFSLILMAAGFWVVLMLGPATLPNFANPVSATDIARLVFSARCSCMHADGGASTLPLSEKTTLLSSTGLST